MLEDNISDLENVHKNVVVNLKNKLANAVILEPGKDVKLGGIDAKITALIAKKLLYQNIHVATNKNVLQIYIVSTESMTPFVDNLVFNLTNRDFVWRGDVKVVSKANRHEPTNPKNKVYFKELDKDWQGLFKGELFKNSLLEMSNKADNLYFAVADWTSSEENLDKQNENIKFKEQIAKMHKSQKETLKATIEQFELSGKTASWLIQFTSQKTKIKVVEYTYITQRNEINYLLSCWGERTQLSKEEVNQKCKTLLEQVVIRED